MTYMRVGGAHIQRGQWANVCFFEALLFKYANNHENRVMCYAKNYYETIGKTVAEEIPLYSDLLVTHHQIGCEATYCS